MQNLNFTFWVDPKKPLNLSEIKTEPKIKFKKEAAQAKINEDIIALIELQELLYVANQHGVLIILQAMDAAGKDGAIKHVMSGLNPQGVNVTSFKHPTHEDYDNNFFWRFNKSLPARGEIAIFNRSYYEHTLICRVHPKYILNEKIPGINTVEDINDKFWHQRFKQFKRFEKNLVQNGIIILKFYLHISPDEQLERLSDRIKDPNKHYKFNFGDLEERKFWKEYMRCYEETMLKTSTEKAPWFVIPADNKWYARTIIARILKEKLKSLNLTYPALSKDELTKIKAAFNELKK